MLNEYFADHLADFDASVYQSVSKAVVDVIVATHIGRMVHVTDDNEIMAVRLCKLVRLTLFLFIYHHYLSSFYKYYFLMNVENALTDLSSLELLDRSSNGIQINFKAVKKGYILEISPDAIGIYDAFGFTD